MQAYTPSLILALLGAILVLHCSPSIPLASVCAPFALALSLSAVCLPASFVHCIDLTFVFAVATTLNYDFE